MNIACKITLCIVTCYKLYQNKYFRVNINFKKRYKYNIKLIWSRNDFLKLKSN